MYSIVNEKKKLPFISEGVFWFMCYKYALFFVYKHVYFEVYEI